MSEWFNRLKVGLIVVGIWAAVGAAGNEPQRFQFQDAPAGSWDQVSPPRGWSSDEPARVRTVAGGSLSLRPGATAVVHLETPVGDRNRYTLNALLGGGEDAVAVVRLVAGQPDAGGESHVLTELRYDADGRPELEVVTRRGDTAAAKAAGQSLRLELTNEGQGEASFANLYLEGRPMDPFYDQLVERGIECIEFNVPVDDHEVIATIGLPPADQRAEDPLLLLTLGGVSTHFVPPNELPAEHFWERGHPVVSFSFGSMPGDLHDYRDAVLAGPDPTLGFIREAKAVIDACVERGWAKRDRVVVTGISRFGYLALRLVAADEQLTHVGAFSPVTDWKYLSEFEGYEDKPAVEAMRLTNYVEGLVGKRVYMAIGNHDERVSTLSCTRFYLDLNEANAARGIGREPVDLYLTPSPTHTLDDEWYHLGMQRLFDSAIKP